GLIAVRPRRLICGPRIRLWCGGISSTRERQVALCLRHILSAAANRSRESLSRRSAGARALSTFPGQHHPVPDGQADRVKALLTRSTDEIELFQRESFPFPGEHDSIAYC